MVDATGQIKDVQIDFGSQAMNVSPQYLAHVTWRPLRWAAGQLGDPFTNMDKG